MKDVIKGGLADKMPDSSFDKKQLAMGVKVEREHTTSAQKAREIARDHLSEHETYYSELKKMEAKLEKGADLKTVAVRKIITAVKDGRMTNAQAKQAFKALEGKAPVKMTSAPRRVRTSNLRGPEPSFYGGFADEMGKMGAMNHRQLARFRKQLQAIRGKTKSTDTAAKKTVSLKKPTTDRRKLGPFDDHDSHVYDADFLRKSIAEGEKRYGVPSRKSTARKANSAGMSEAERRYNLLTYGDPGL